MDSLLKPVMNGMASSASFAERRFSLANLVTAQIEMKRSLGSLGTDLKRLSVRASSRRRMSKAPATPFIIPTLRSTNEMSTTSVISPTTPNVSELPADSWLCSSAEVLFGKQVSLMSRPSLAIGKQRSVSQWSLDGLKENQISFINQIGEAVSDSDHLWDFLRKAFRILYFTKLSTIFMFAMAIFHLVVIFTGLKHFDNCPIEPKIPIYLFVCGWVGLLKSLHLIWYKFRSSSSLESDDSESDAFNQDNAQRDGTTDGLDEASLSKSSYFTDALLNLFILVWFILGNYWVLSIYMPKFRPPMYEPNNFCDRSLYMFTLIQLGFYYALIGLTAFLVVILTIFTQIPYLIVKFQEF